MSVSSNIKQYDWNPPSSFNDDIDVERSNCNLNTNNYDN